MNKPAIEFRVIVSTDLKEFCELVEAAIAGGWQLGPGFGTRTHTTETNESPDSNGVVVTRFEQVPVYYQPIIKINEPGIITPTLEPPAFTH